MTRLVRLVRLVQRDEAITTSQLIDSLDVSRRTLFRDLKVLRDAGYHVTYDQEHGYQIDDPSHE